MGDHFVLDVDRLKKSSSGSGERQPLPPPEMLAGPSSSSSSLNERLEEEEANDVEAPLITIAECRICQDEDSISNMDSPCACSGSLKYAHRKCVQHWCNEKGDLTCEICHQPYHPGYTAPTRPRLEETTIDIGGGWQISGMPLDLHDPRILAIAEAERQFLEADYDDYNSTNASGAAFFRSAALILMALLLLRHAVTVTDADGEDNASTFFTLFLLRATGFLLPCYIMAWAISILQRRRQRQEAAALAATQFAFVLQSAQSRGLHLTIASASAAPTLATRPPAQQHA